MLSQPACAPTSSCLCSGLRQTFRQIGHLQLEDLFAGGEEGIVELGLLAHELEGVSVGLCGLQELHWLGKRECDVYAQPSG